MEDLARPHVLTGDLEESYPEMAAERDREQEAQDWSDGLIADGSPPEPHAPR